MKKLTVFICFALVSAFVQAQWTVQYTSETDYFTSVYFTDANTGYVIGWDNGLAVGGILKTIDGGSTWDILSSGTTTWLNSVFFTNANTGYVVGDYGTIIKTLDGGTTWNNLSSGTTTQLNSVYFINADTGYVVGGNSGDWSDGTILKTINGGITWDAIFSNKDIDLSSVFFTDAKTGYAAGFNLIIKTIDGGSTWDKVWCETVNPIILNSVFFIDENTGYAAGFNLIIKTMDGGTTWDTLLEGTTYGLESVYFTDAYIGYAVGKIYLGSFPQIQHKPIIMKTIDGGITWDTLSCGTSSPLNSVFFPNANTGYVVGNGTILKTTNGGVVSIKEIQTQTPASIFTIYPNPATNKISITTPGNSQGETQISIFSINGAKTGTYKFSNTDKFEIDISQLAKGIYLLQLQSAEGVETLKLVEE